MHCKEFREKKVNGQIWKKEGETQDANIVPNHFAKTLFICQSCRIKRQTGPKCNFGVCKKPTQNLIYMLLTYNTYNTKQPKTQNLIQYLPDIWIGPVRVMNKHLTEYSLFL